jgi:phosphopantetheine adenylyltransferase
MYKGTLTNGHNIIVSYNASVVKNYNVTGSLVRFENKNIFFNIEKRSSLVGTTQKS